MLKKTISSLLLLAATISISQGQKLPAFELDLAWKQKVAEVAPKAPAVAPQQPRKVLIFSLVTGFQHWCVPHTEAVIEILGQQSGAYESVASVDVEVFRPERLQEFDAVVLNNNCPTRGQRDMFYDVLVKKMGAAGKRYEAMPQSEREALAQFLYQSLLDYVADGGGLVLMHGAIANFNESSEFSALAGGSFDFHPPQQELELQLVHPQHPLLAPFGGKPFVHIDEPYMFTGAYEKLNFLPLLEIDTSTIHVNSAERKKAMAELPRYVAWIKPHGQGRVFFSSPSHNAQSFERPELLGFLLNGMQYALGDLECKDQRSGEPNFLRK